MKKTKLIIAILALVLCFTCLFAACKQKDSGKEPTETKSGDIFTAETYRATNAHRYSDVIKLELDGYSYSTSNRELIVFTKTESDVKTTAIYNIAENRIVQTFVDESDLLESVTYTVSLSRANGIPYFVAHKKTRDLSANTDAYAHTLYNAKGTLMTTVEDDASNTLPSVTIDFVKFGDKLYRMEKDGTLALLDWYGPLSNSIPSLDGKQGDYYYKTSTSASNMSVTVYDATLKLKAYYALPSYAKEPVFGVLDNGNVFIQYFVAKDATDNDYDVIFEENDGIFRDLAGRYDLEQKILNIADNSTSDMRIDYIAYYLMSKTTLEEEGESLNAINKDFLNLCVAYKLNDKYVDLSREMILTLTNNGSLQTVITGTFLPNEDDFAEVVAEDRVLVEDLAGRKYLYKFDKTLIGEVSDADFLADFILGETAVYDYNLSVLFAYKDQGYSYYGRMGDNLVFTKNNEENETEYYLYTGTGTPTMIASGNQSYRSYRSATYAVTSYDDSHNVLSVDLYNAQGTKLITLDNMISSDYGSTDEGFIIKTYDAENKEVYYLVK